MRKFLVPVLSVNILLCSLCMAQSPNALSARKVQDYFQDVESKSYYQQERIRSMKGEMNEYSERLHGLQEKFNKIFYGRSMDKLHQSPFNDKDKVSYPKRNYRNPVPVQDAESMVRRPSSQGETKNRSNQLAFTVDDGISQPLDRSPSTPPPNTIEPEFEKFTHAQSNPRRKGYFIIRPGFTFSYKRKVTNYSNYPGKTKVREYKNGFSLLVSGGFKFENGIKIGGGAFHRISKHESGKSYQAWPNQTNYYHNGSESVSWGGFAELGYEHSFVQSLGFYTNLGLGYGVSITDKSSGSDMEDFVFATAGFGLTWTPFEHFAASLGYRYLHEREVPAHAIELGLEGKF
jgi:hypothetical protein